MAAVIHLGDILLKGVEAWMVTVLLCCHPAASPRKFQEKRGRYGISPFALLFGASSPHPTHTPRHALSGLHSHNMGCKEKAPS